VLTIDGCLHIVGGHFGATGARMKCASVGF
jgi:hypothetical protein